MGLKIIYFKILFDPADLSVGDFVINRTAGKE